MKAQLGILCILAVLINAACGSISPRQSENKSKAFYDAWSYYSRGETEKAFEIAKRFYKPEMDYSLSWPILMGLIYFKQGKYQEVIDTFGKIRPRIDEHFELLSSNQCIVTDDERDAFTGLYFKMLAASGPAHYILGNWNAALKDLLVFTRKYPTAVYYDLIAISYYRTQQYSESLEYFRRSYDLHDPGEWKIEAAYNVAVTSAILGNVEETVLCLRIPLENDRKRWLSEIEKNDDFDAIRNDGRFKEFLEQQRALSEQK
jgi:tetratricopeptide (TPR) repeat protein